MEEDNGDVVDTGADVGTEEDAQPPQDASDIGPDEDTSPDVDGLPEHQLLGSACNADDQCGEQGVCKGSVCLSYCAQDSDCIDGAACFSIGGEDLCAPRCRDTERCDHVDGHDALRCVYVVETRDHGSSPHSLSRACLTDSADDGVFDGIDNCSDAINPDQRDSTGDGVGDICSSTPRCHVQSSEGIFEVAPTSFRPGSFTAPHAVEGRWLPVVGTVDGSGGAESSWTLLDRHSGEWHDQEALRFAGAGRFIAPTNGGGYIVSPGVRSGGDIMGAWTHINALGEATYEHPFRELEDGAPNITPLMPPARLSNGAHKALLVNSSVGDVTFYTAQFTDDFTYEDPVELGGLTGPAQRFYSDFERPPQTLHHPDGSVGFSAWFGRDNTIFYFDVPAPRSAPGAAENLHLLPIPEEVEGEDLSDFSPFVFPAIGGQLYVFDRHTGRAGRFLAQRSSEDLLDRQWGDFERTPEYDLSEFDDFTDPALYLLPAATGIGIVGRPAGESDSLQVREIYFECHPRSEDIDTSGDGVGDIVDNCPLEDNPDQDDLDGDFWGDACDPDIDGDGIPNALDVDGATDLSRDSNNNGVPNEDDDDIDGDGIANQYDPFPLDSSNNGTPNRWTDDASGNQYSDDELRQRNLDPYNFFSLPAGPGYVFITEDAEGERTLFRGAIDERGVASPIEFSEELNPHQPRFDATHTRLYLLTDAPGETNRFVVYDLATQDIVEDYELEDDQGAPLMLRSVSMVDDDQFLVVHERNAGSSNPRWSISTISTANDEITPLFSDMDHLWFAHLIDDHLIFVGADTDCRECAAGYRYSVDDDEYEFIATTASGVLDFAAHGDVVTFATTGTSNSVAMIHHLSDAATRVTDSTRVDPPFQTLKAVSFSHYRAEDGSPDPQMASMTMAAINRWDQSTDIWIHLPHMTGDLSPWHLLLATDDTVVEVQWSP